MILIWSLLILAVVSRAEDNEDLGRHRAKCGDNSCSDGTNGACYAKWWDSHSGPPSRVKCDTFRHCYYTCDGDDCCCYSPNVEGIPPDNCISGFQQDKRDHGTRMCYNGDTPQGFRNYARTFPIYCTIDKSGQRRGTTSKEACDEVRRDNGCCCMEDNCNKDMKSCGGEAFESFCGNTGCSDVDHVCYATWNNGENAVQCKETRDCVTSCKGENCCCYLPSQEKGEQPPLDCPKLWKEDLAQEYSKSCYDGSGSSSHEQKYRDYPRLLPIRCSIDKSGMKSGTQSKVLCDELKADSGCCCRDNDCNRSMKACRDDIIH